MEIQDMSLYDGFTRTVNRFQFEFGFILFH